MLLHFCTRQLLLLLTASLSLSFPAPTGDAAEKSMNGSSGMSLVQPERSLLSRPTANEPDLFRIVREIDAGRIEQTIRKLVSFGTRNTLSTQNDPNRGIGAARDWLYGEFQKVAAESDGRLQVEKQTFTQPVGPRVPRPTVLTNIIGFLPGERATPEQRVYVVSGHYDSMCSSPTDAEHDAPGANDDASGTAAVLEMARVMAKYRFDAPIVFMTVPGEEQGLLGATYAAEQMKEKKWRVQAMFTNDIIGNTKGGNGVHDDKTVRVFSEGVPTDETTAQATTRRSVGGETDSASRQLARYIKEIGAKYVHGLKVTMIYRRDRYSRGGDHIPFLERGVPAVRFTEPNENYQHQHQNVRTENGIVYGDLPEFVDFAYVAQVARVNAAALASLASAPDAPREAGLSSRLSDDTTLRWRANEEPDLAGYEIVWRETDIPLWNHARFVGKVTEYTVKGLSKDNYFFGVRAIDTHGRKSPVSYPRPSR